MQPAERPHRRRAARPAAAWRCEPLRSPATCSNPDLPLPIDCTARVYVPPTEHTRRSALHGIAGQASGGGRDRPETAPSARREAPRESSPWPVGRPARMAIRRRFGDAGVSELPRQRRQELRQRTAFRTGQPRADDPRSGPQPGLPHRWPDARGARDAFHGRHARSAAPAQALDWVTIKCQPLALGPPTMILTEYSPWVVRVRFHRSTARVRMMSLGSCGPRATTRPAERRPLVPSGAQESNQVVLAIPLIGAQPQATTTARWGC